MFRKSSAQRSLRQHAVAKGEARVIQVAGDYYAPPSRSDLPAWHPVVSLPPEPRLLVGRQEDVHELLDLLSSGAEETQSPAVIAVTGLPGIGKTALAVHAARLAHQQGLFHGGVLFADLHGYDQDMRVTGDQVLRRWLRDLGIADADVPAAAEERESLYHSVLYRAASSGRRLLLLADNASSAEQVRPLLPPGNEHRLLVTSRESLVSLPARQVHVAQLDLALAADLIAGILLRAWPGDPRPQAEPAALDRLAGICGQLPLALEITAQVLAGDPGLPIANVSEAIENEQASSSLEHVNAHLAPVQAAFELSYHRLNLESARVFRLLALNPGPGIATDAAAALANQPVARVRDLLATLARASLIDEQPTGSGWWLMHDLVHTYALRLTEQDRSENPAAVDRLLEHYSSTSMDAARQLEALPGQQSSDQFASRDDALAWLDRNANNLVAAVRLAATGTTLNEPAPTTARNLTACSLAFAVYPYLDLRFRYDEQLAVSELAATEAHRLGNTKLETIALLNLGQAQNNAGRYDEALTTQLQAEQMARSCGDRHEEALALGQRAQTLADLSRFEEALTVYQDTMTVFRDLGEHGWEARALNSIGTTQKKMGLREEAITTYRTAESLSRQARDREAEASVLLNLSNTLGELGHVQPAIDAGNAALAIYRELDDKYRAGKVWQNLGMTFRKIRGFEHVAIPVLQLSVDAYKDAGDYQGAARVLRRIGFMLARPRNSRSQAVQAYKESIELFTKVNNPQGAAFGFVALSLVLPKIRKPEESVAAAQQAVAHFRLACDLAGEAEALTILGIALARVRRFDEAISAFDQARENFHVVHDSMHETFAANMLAAARKKQRARILLSGTTILLPS